jgi:toxin ParE1/3/4
VSETARTWRLRETDAALADYRQIIAWTAAQFGRRQADVYAETIATALASLAAGPTAAGAKLRDDIARGLYSLHVARGGRKGRHFIIFRTVRDRRGGVIEVLRVLHDAMDLRRHLPLGGSDE